MSTETMSSALAWRDALADVSVAADQATAVVSHREITADSPREMRRLLAEAIYDVLHAGQQVEKGALSFRLRDDEFERILAAAVPHRTTDVPVRWCGESRVSPDGVAVSLVERDGVRVWVPQSMIAAAAACTAGDVVAMTTSPCRPALSPGFFLVDGSRPRPAGQEVLRVYINITDWTAAATVFSQVLGHLEQRGAEYRAKILSAKGLYPRRDAMVVYLGRTSWPVASELVEVVERIDGVGSETSVFASRLGRGIAIAWESDDDRPGMRGLSFGQHRATALALALLDVANDRDPATLERAIRVRFGEAGIDPECPARNHTSSEFVMDEVHEEIPAPVEKNGAGEKKGGGGKKNSNDMEAAWTHCRE